MKENKLKLIMAAVSISILFSITGCSSSASSNTKTEKLALTKENVQKVFSDKYNVRISEVDNERKSINASFDTKTNIPKNKSKETLKDIEDTLNKKFDVNNKQNIYICIYKVNDDILIKDYYGKIQVGEKPEIYIKTPNEFGNISYSMSKKFNLLNPVKNVTVSAKDKEDGDITSKIKLKNPEVLTKTSDFEKLIYVVTDSDGNISDGEEVIINVMK